MFVSTAGSKKWYLISCHFVFKSCIIATNNVKPMIALEGEGGWLSHWNWVVDIPNYKLLKFWLRHKISIQNTWTFDWHIICPYIRNMMDTPNHSYTQHNMDPFTSIYTAYTSLTLSTTPTQNMQWNWNP